MSWANCLIQMFLIVVGIIAGCHMCMSWAYKILQVTEKHQISQLPCSWTTSLITDEGKVMFTRIVVIDESWIHHYNPKSMCTTKKSFITISLWVFGFWKSIDGPFPAENCCGWWRCWAWCDWDSSEDTAKLQVLNKWYNDGIVVSMLVEIMLRNKEEV